MPTSNLPFEQQYPLINDAEKKMLDWLNEHPDAPRYNHTCGNRLSAEGLEQTLRFDELIQSEPPVWDPNQIPTWVMPFMQRAMQDVPFYRQYGAPPERFADLPAFTRADLAHAPWRFVPDSANLDDLIVYGTSGTTGHPIDIPCSPAVSHMYLPLLRAALNLWRVDWQGGPGRIACLLVCSQKTTYTLTSVSPYLQDAGWAKINLNPAEWPASESASRFIDACNPEIFTGDPLAFSDLARLPLKHRPKALISSAMAFLPGLREALSTHFDCPVIDLYSMTEAGPIAATYPGGAGHLLLQPRLFVEILNQAGQPCPPGVLGEITLTGGFNPYLPLLRYRTNDYARLEWSGSTPILMDLQGRPPTLFRTTSGAWINNVDINNAFRPFALAQFHLHQNADGRLKLEITPELEKQPLRDVLLPLFGADQELEIAHLASSPSSGKVLQYTSDLPVPLPG